MPPCRQYPSSPTVCELCCCFGLILLWKAPQGIGVDFPDLVLFSTENALNPYSYLHTLGFQTANSHHRFTTMTDDQTSKGNNLSSPPDSAPTTNRNCQSDRPSCFRKDSSTHVFPKKPTFIGPKTSRKSDKLTHQRDGSSVQSSFLATPFDDVNKLFGGLDWLLEATTQTRDVKSEQLDQTITESRATAIDTQSAGRKSRA